MSNHYAVIIGNSLYDHLERLTAPALDARAIMRVLADPLIGDYVCQLELNQDSQRLRRVIEDLFIHKVKKNDTALIYFSGHGLINDAGELHLTTKDTDQRYLSATSISAEFIRKVMDESLAERKIVILDSCHSGAFTSGMKGELETARRARWEFGRGVAILTASRDLQYSFEIEGLSIFTSLLVEALETGVRTQANKDVISVNDLFAYIATRMEALNIKQRPQVSTIKQEGEIVVANNPNSTQFALPENVERLLKSSQRVELQQAIDILRQYAQSENRFWARQAINNLQKLSNHSSQMIQTSAKQVLAEVDRVLQQPEIRFASSEVVKTVTDWINLVEMDKQYWPEAAEFLFSGVLGEWLNSINRPDLERVATQISKQPHFNRLVGLEQFQRVAGSLPRQQKANAVTNLDDLLGKLIYWRIPKHRHYQDFQFEIMNQGRGYMHGEVISKVRWIKIEKPMFGCLPEDKDKVKITVDLDRYKFYGIYPFPLDFRLS